MILELPEENSTIKFSKILIFPHPGISPENSPKVSQKPNKKRFTLESSGIPLAETKAKKIKNKKAKVANFYQNFTQLVVQIKNNAELCKNVLTNFQNLWTLTHRKLKKIEIPEFETRYYNLLYSSEKLPFQSEPTQRFF